MTNMKMTISVIHYSIVSEWREYKRHRYLANDGYLHVFAIMFLSVPVGDICSWGERVLTR